MGDGPRIVVTVVEQLLGRGALPICTARTNR